MNILIVGPSTSGTPGGMATVIQDMLEDPQWYKHHRIYHLITHNEGSSFSKLMHALIAYTKFLLIAWQFDVVHIHAATRASIFRKAFFVYVARWFHKPAIIHIHGSDYDSFFRNASSRTKAFLTKLHNLASCNIVLSQYWKQFFISEMSVRNIAVIPNGVDTSLYAASRTPYQSGKLLFLGRLGERKGIYDLIQAMVILRDRGLLPRLYLAGDGELEKVMEKIQVSNLQNQISIEGWCDKEKKLALLRATSVLILPSYNEGLPVAILEAMAAGKVIISTPVGGIPELIIPQQNGFLVPPGDIDSLANAIEQTMLPVNEEIMRTISSRNEQRISETFDRQIIYNNLISLYHQVSEKKDFENRH